MVDGDSFIYSVSNRQPVSVMKYFALCLSFIIGLIFLGCSHTTELTKKHLPENTAEVNYSVIYYIHADSDYLYHTNESEPVRENSEVLATAFEVGKAARSGEVFIYYQRSEKKLLGLFPRKSSRFFHYKNGQLINRVKYRHPDKEEPFLTTEAQLLNKYRAQNRADKHQNYLLYFGHEIPSENGKGYHRSLPAIDVNTLSFTKGIQNFLLSDEDHFDLVVLSTCNNGTPDMAELLMPFTRTMLASPQNLHLSHYDSGRMELLESETEISPLKLGHSMAEQTFQRLDTTVHTAITLALYDLKTIQPYIQSLSTHIANEDSERSPQIQDNVDCDLVHPFESEVYREGIETWYKPARFGRQSSQSTHSGWGCKPVVK